MHRRATRVFLAASFAAAAAAWCAPARAACPAGTANKLYADARHAFEERRYDDSLTMLHRAYACEPNPVYLGNVARTLEEARRPKDAIVAWRAYRDVITDPKERTQTEGRISALSKVVEDLDRLEADMRAAEEARRRAEEERARSASTAATPPTRESPPESGPRIATGAWVVTGVGVAGLATGVVLGLVANGKHSSAVEERDVVRAASLQSDARTFAGAASVALVAGGVVTAAGLTWIGIDLFRTPRAAMTAARTSLVVHPTSIALEGHF